MTEDELKIFLSEYIGGMPGHTETTAEAFITEYRSGVANFARQQEIVHSILQSLNSEINNNSIQHTKALLQFLQASGLAFSNVEIRNQLLKRLSLAVVGGSSQFELVILLGSFIYGAGIPAFLPLDETALSVLRLARDEFGKNPGWTTWQLLANIAASRSVSTCRSSEVLSDLRFVRETNKTMFSARLQERNSLLQRLGTDVVEVLSILEGETKRASFENSNFRRMTTEKLQERWTSRARAQPN